MAPGPDRPAQLGIERLDGIGGVQNSSDLSGKSIKRDDLGPGAPPALANGRVFLAPGALLEGSERGLAGFGVNRPVDVLERRRNRLSILPGDEIEAVAQQVDDAGLYRGLREDSRDRLGEALQAVDDGDQHVLDAAVFQLVHDAQPELGALVLFEPQPQDFLAAVGAHAERDMDSLVAYQSFVADLDPQRVEKDQRVDRFQRPRLPGSHFLQHRVGYRADQIGRDVDPVELTKMADNRAGAHAAGVHRDDLVIKPRKAALVSGDQLRIETGLAVARYRQLDPAGIGEDRLLAITIAPIARLLAGQVMVHLGVENPFGQGLLQIVEQPIGLQRASRIGAGQQLIEHGIRDMRFFASRHGWAPLLPSCPTPHEIPDSPMGLSARRGRRRTPRTTDSRHHLPVAPNLLARNFTADRPDQSLPRRRPGSGWPTSPTSRPTRASCIWPRSRTWPRARASAGPSPTTSGPSCASAPWSWPSSGIGHHAGWSTTATAACNTRPSPTGRCWSGTASRNP